MSKYIDADKAIKNYARYGISHFYDATDLEAILNECPAADVQEVRHGRWEYTKELYRDPNGNHLFYGKICSECHNVSPYDSPYCMNCGANMQQGVTLVGTKMDEVKE